jgi:hypothetical protein
LLVFTIGGGEGVRELVVGKGEDVIEKVEIWLVAIAGWVGLIQVGDERSSAGGGIGCHRDGSTQGKQVLSIEVCFTAIGLR